jgi:hypothetical protein
MSLYHIRVTSKLACGCTVESALELPEDEAPSGEAIVVALVNQITDPEYLGLLVNDHHVARGNERLTIELKTMVGPLPEEL